MRLRAAALAAMLGTSQKDQLQAHQDNAVYNDHPALAESNRLGQEQPAEKDARVAATKNVSHLSTSLHDGRW